MNKASKIFGLVISGKRMLPYLIPTAPTIEPAPSFPKYFKSSCEPKGSKLGSSERESSSSSTPVLEERTAVSGRKLGLIIEEYLGLM